MAYEIPDLMVTYPAGADLSASQYRGMAQNSSDKLVVPADGARIAGVLQNKPEINEAGTVMVSGVTKMEASAAIAVDAEVSVTANGRAVTSVATKWVIGIARTAAGAAGQYLSVQLVGPYLKA